MTIFGFLLIYSLAIYGAWTVGCKVRDWLYGDDKVDVTRLDSVADAAITTASNTNEVADVLRDIRGQLVGKAGIKPVEVKAKRQPRKATPTTPSGKTARKRGTKLGK